MRTSLIDHSRQGGPLPFVLFAWLPAFLWLKVSGQAGVDDLGISDDHRLVVSEKLLKVVQEDGNLEHCDVMEYA